MTVNYNYDGKFNSNVLIAGQTFCGKTTFMQNLAKNRMFGDIKSVFWLSKIELSKDREQTISTYFHGVPVRFLYPRTWDDMYLGFFQKKKGKWYCKW